MILWSFQKKLPKTSKRESQHEVAPMGPDGHSINSTPDESNTRRQLHGHF